MLSRKHYVKIAEIISDTRNDDSIDATFLVERLAVYFRSDNPNFSLERFATACKQEGNQK